VNFWQAKRKKFFLENQAKKKGFQERRKRGEGKMESEGEEREEGKERKVGKELERRVARRKREKEKT
jgi:hypothetical protein